MPLPRWKQRSWSSYQAIKPVDVKARRYFAKKRAFLKECVDKLVKLEFLIPNHKSQELAAPLLMPKIISRAEFRLEIDLRPIHAAL